MVHAVTSYHFLLWCMSRWSHRFWAKNGISFAQKWTYCYPRNPQWCIGGGRDQFNEWCWCEWYAVSCLARSILYEKMNNEYNDLGKPIILECLPTVKSFTYLDRWIVDGPDDVTYKIRPSVHAVSGHSISSILDGRGHQPLWKLSSLWISSQLNWSKENWSVLKLTVIDSAF